MQNVQNYFKYHLFFIFSKVANMLSVAGADHIITMDLHASQIQVFVLIVAVVTVVVVILVICVSVDCWSC